MLELICSLKNNVALVTLAPEEVDPSDIEKLCSRGIKACLGHSDASHEVTRAALTAGARDFTHLYNAMSPLESGAPGMVGAALADQESWGAFIADGVHVHWASLQIAIAAKTAAKCILVTDAMPPVGGKQPRCRLNNE